MEILWIIGIASILMFCGVVAFGAPFLPTLSKRIDDAVELLDLKPGQTLLELGSGDGRLLKAVAKKGVYAIGYELNPMLVAYTYLSTWRYRKYVTVKCRNYWQVKWPESDAMYVFLLNPYMSKLHKKVVQYLDHSDAISGQPANNNTKNYKLVSFAFEITDKKPAKSKNGMFLYKY